MVRQRELAELTAAVATVRGGAPAGVVVSAEPGAGKTTLVDAAMGHAGDAGLRTARITCAEGDGTAPFGLADQVLRGLGGGPADRGPHQHQGFRRQLTELVGRRPTAMAIDDLQWADEASVRLVAYTLLRRPPAPLLLIVARRTRPELPSLDLALAASAGHHDLRLDPLTPAETDLLLDGLSVRGDRREVIRASGGNPRLLLLLAASDRPLDLSPDLSAALESALAAALDPLDTSAGLACTVAAVAGDPFELDLAAVAAGQAPEHIAPGIDALVAAGVLESQGTAQSFGFRHPLVRRAALVVGDPVLVEEAHARLATHLDGCGAPATRLAPHLAQATVARDPEAAVVLLAAATVMAVDAPTEAAAWCRAGLARTDDPAVRKDLLIVLAEAELASGQLRAAAEALDLLRIEHGPSDVDSVIRRAHLDQALGHHEASEARLRRALADTCPDVEAAILVTLAQGRARLCDYDGTVAQAREAVAAARTGPPAVRVAAQAIHAIGVVCSEGADAGAALLDDVLDNVADGAPDDWAGNEVDALVLAGNAAMWGERPAAAVTLVQRADDLARRDRRSRSRLVWSSTDALLPLVTLGLVAEATERAVHAVDVARIEDTSPQLCVALAAEALCRALAGEGEDAAVRTVVALALDTATAHPGSMARASALVLCSRALAVLGDHGGAAAVLSTFARERKPPMLLRAYADEVRCAAAAQAGDRLAARAWSDHAASLAPGPLTTATAERCRVIVGVVEGDLDAAVDAAHTADGRAVSVGAQMDAAWAQVPLCAAGLRDAVATSARLTALGAVGLAARIGRPALTRSPGGITRTSDGAARPLTPRQREVADMVASGLTNREIAVRLNIGERTVDSHVRRVLAALGAPSRAAVGRALVSAGAP